MAAFEEERSSWWAEEERLDCIEEEELEEGRAFLLGGRRMGMGTELMGLEAEIAVELEWSKLWSMIDG